MRIWLTTLVSQAAWAFRRSLFTRRVLLLVAALALLLTIQALVLAHRGSPRFVNFFFFALHSWATLSIVVPLGAMFLGVTALLDDTERGSIAYLLSRPAPRSAILLGRATGAAAAGVIMALALVGASVSLVEQVGRSVVDGVVTVHLDPAQGPALHLAASLGAVCFVAFGTFFGALTRRGLLWGAGIVLVGELVVGTVISRSQLTGFRSLLATDMTRQLFLVRTLPVFAEDQLSRIGRVSSLPEKGIGATDLCLGLGQYTLVMLTLAVILFCLREQPYKNKDS